MKKFSIGLGTIVGVFGGIVLGALLWLVAAGIDAAMNVLPANGEVVLFFVGFAASIGAGVTADLLEAEKEEKK